MLARSPARSPGPIVRSLHRFLLNRTALLGLCTIALMIVAILSYPLWWSFKPNDIDLIAMNAQPGPTHWFGTDGVGRDILARVMDSGRISLLVALTSTVISAIIGFLVGAVSALAGRWADAVTMRFVDLVMTLPPVIFLLVLASIAGTGIWPTVFVISLLSWPLLARMVRSRLLELRERDFVMAARGMGAGLPHLLFRHGLPNSIDILVVFATLQIANAILLEAGLSFLGLGIAPPAASWGNMLNAARSTAVLEQYLWQWLFPGGFLVLAVLAINFIGDGLRDAFDPRAELN
ncbi:ABC transporter permease [Rhizobium sp. Nf11,1]|uniref:ABC transporter permease n=1 Tax=Rhizobium sp. Nf11,1 TaxID=3404923 RepID=UPI003D33CA65